MNIGNTAADFEVGAAARRGNIETAIKAYRNALTVYTRQAAPERWARMMLNLGSAFAERREGSRADNIERAIEAQNSALSFYTPTSDPPKWAIGQRNLGNAYRARIEGDRARNLKAAAEAFNAALTVTASPLQHMWSAQAAGEVAALRGDWRTAQDHLASAIAASTQLFGEGLNAVDAARVVRAGGRLFGSAAYVAAELGEAEKALDLLEAGRARLLRAALGLDALALPDADRNRLAALRAALPELEAQLQTVTGDERLAILKALEEKRNAIERIISSRLAATTSDPLHASGTALAASVLQDYGAIVAPVVTELGTKLLVATRGNAQPSITVLGLGDLTGGVLQQFIRGSMDNDELGGRLAAYIGMARGDAPDADKRFNDAVRDLGPSLWRMIGSRIVEALAKAGVLPDARIVWLPNGALGLLPIGLAGADAGKASLLDRHTLVVAPSLAALERSRRRLQSDPAPASLAGAINPTGDLAFTELEGAAVASYFRADAHLLYAGGAQRDAVLAALKTAGYWHFATHGTFLWGAPRDSALILADRKPLTVGNLLDQVGLGHPRLVLLSACETGLYDFQTSPDEFIGLPSAFLQVGAIGVVGTLWPVNDVSTSLVMMKFYDLHRSGKIEPATALRRAQLWLRDSTSASLRDFVAQMGSGGRLTEAQKATMLSAIGGGSGTNHERPFSHPFYWAPFQYFGA
jgi:CHAT domain-containing protein/tetratricopeptide (TPR) repeat protein